MPFVKGQSGNPTGRPVGSRNRFTREMDEALELKGIPLVDAILAHAQAANPTAMRLCWERLAGKRRPCSFQMPPLETPDFSVAALTEVQRALGAGEITSEEAARLVDLVGRIVRVLAVTAAAEIDFAERLDRSEDALGLLLSKRKRAARPDPIPVEEAPGPVAEVKSEGVIDNNNAKTMGPAAQPAEPAPTRPAEPPPVVAKEESISPATAAALDAAVRATLPPRRESVKQRLMNSVSPTALLVGEVTERVLAKKTASVTQSWLARTRAA